MIVDSRKVEKTNKLTIKTYGTTDREGCFEWYVGRALNGIAQPIDQSTGYSRMRN
jgi:hypothetical protein